MSRSSRTHSLLAAATLALCATVAGAQQPASPPPARDGMRHDMPHDMNHDGPGMKRMGAKMRHPGGPGARPGGVAAMLLGQTAVLKLSDQQVTRLAAIARGAEAQESSVRAMMDSVHRAMAPRAGGAPPQLSPAMESRMKAVHEQLHANVRDALAVLTPDQLATAWELRGGMAPSRAPRGQ
jgi:hypothetical protein